MSLRMRRGSAPIGGGDPEPPPETPAYGPIEGRQAIIDNSGPRSVSAPGTPFTQITTVDNASFQSILNAAGAGTPGARKTFWVRAGTYQRTAALGTIQPLDYQTIVCESGVIFEGNQMDAHLIHIQNTRQGITWRGGKIQNVGTTASFFKYGMNFRGPNNPTTPSLVEDLEITNVLGVNGPVSSPIGGIGMLIGCPGGIVRHCFIHDNGRAGYQGAGSATTGPGADNMLITRCKFSGNNAQSAPTGGEAGTGKTADNFSGGFNNLRFTKNYINGDLGFGFWTDGISPGTTGISVSENVIENCSHSGIFIELTACAASIFRNYLISNGGGHPNSAPFYTNQWQILISTSNGTLGAPGGIVIEKNVLDATTNATAKLVGLLQTDGHGTGATTRVRGVTVRDNQMFLRTTAGQCVGGHDESVAHSLYSEPTIAWNFNQYHQANLNSNDWRWADANTSNGVSKVYAAWQAYGFDPNSTRSQL